MSESIDLLLKSPKIAFFSWFLSVEVSVCLSVETPSFPVEMPKFWLFNPPISCGTVVLCVENAESV
jgi:hypothetical protein